MHSINLLVVAALLATVCHAAPSVPIAPPPAPAPPPGQLPKCDWIYGPKYNPAGCKRTYILEGRDFSNDYNANITSIKSTGDKEADAKACFEHARSVDHYGAVMEVGDEPGHFKCIAKAFPKIEAYSPYETVRPMNLSLPLGGWFVSWQVLGQFLVPDLVVRSETNPITVDLKTFKALECDILQFYKIRASSTVWCKNVPKADNKTLILGEDCNHCLN